MILFIKSYDGVLSVMLCVVIKWDSWLRCVVWLGVIWLGDWSVV